MNRHSQIIWEQLMEWAKNNLSSGSTDTWLSTCTPISFDDFHFIIGVQNSFVKQQIEDKLISELQRGLRELSYTSTLKFEIMSEDKKSQKQSDTSQQSQSYNKGGLVEEYIFSNFIVGKSNRLAHAASLAVAEKPGIAYNPLFIWGGVGLGKTHLMHAIGHHLLFNNHDSKITYLSSEKFTNELIQSIQSNRTQEFKRRYRSVDILLIDDIQFLANKESTQEEFFHTFNTLYDAKKQVVISSDRPPKEIPSLEERLVSRFEWGLVTDIQPPDLETRIAILQKKAIMKKYKVSEQVLFFIASNIVSNIRELEGALNRVVASGVLSGEAVTVDLAEETLKDSISANRKGPINVEMIQKLVADEMGVSMDDIISEKRTSNLSLARQIAMFLTREKTDDSLQQIGRAFNRRDHTTVMHAISKIAASMDNQPQIRTIVERVRKKL